MSRLILQILWLLFSLTCSTCYADDVHYPVSSIPAQLLKKANVVVRVNHYEVTIASAHEVRTKEHYVATILNDKGAEHGKLDELENSFIKVVSLTGRLYDKNGTELRELKKRDIKKAAPYSYGGITDVYYNEFNFGYGGYPYTVEYEIETVQNMTFFLPDWEPQDSHDCAVESSDIVVRYPMEFPLHYHSWHIPVAPVVQDSGGEVVFSAFVKNAPATTEANEFTYNSAPQLPTIIFSANQFELGRTPGSMASWKELGSFLYKLNEGRDILPESVKMTVHALTDTCKSTTNKIALLYDYMKANTRYVSIQLNIGGWQTFDAQYVASKGYGDCKALSNYMKSLLKEAGILSYQAVVSAGRAAYFAMVEDFPCPKFNHVILCVPGKTDTTWLECTSKTLPAGYLSAFTDNRNVLLVTESGGYMVGTPKSKPGTNAVARSAMLKVDKDQMAGNVNMRYAGFLWEKEEHISEMPKSDMINYESSKFRVGEFTIAPPSISVTRSKTAPFIDEQLQVKGDGIISDNGARVFLTPYIFSNMMAAPPSLESLGSSFELPHSFSVSDTITYQFTGNYTMDTYQRNVSSFQFANYQYKVWLENNNTVKVVYHYQQNEGSYMPATYADYLKLYKEVNTACSNKLVLTRQD